MRSLLSRPLLTTVLPFAAAALLYTAPGFLPERVMVPLDLQLDYGAWKPNPTIRVPADNRLLSDALLEFYPWDVVMREHLIAGRMPWRNPYTNDESHLFANPETAILFPLNWLRVVSGSRGWAVWLFLRLVIAGLAMYWLARTTGVPRPAAILSGLVYLGCGFTILWSMHPHASVAALLPAFAASLWRILQRPDRTNLLLVIFFAAILTAAGHPETLMHGVVGVSVWLAWHFSRTGAPNRRAALLGIAGSAVGFLLIAVQLIPFFFALLDGEFAASRRRAERGPFRPVAVAGMIIPGFLGTPLRGEIDLTALLPGSENFLERSSAYVGLITLVILCLAWKELAPQYRKGLIVGAIALLIAWRLPGLRDLVRHVPLFTLAANERFTLLFAFFASLAAGPAVTIVVAGSRRRALGLLVVIGGSLLLAAGLTPVLPPAKETMKSVARRGIAQLQARGHFAQAPEVYEARLEGYLQTSKRMTVRRFAIPGLFLILGGVGLFMTRTETRRILLHVSIAGELLSFGLCFHPIVRLDEVARTPLAIRDLQRLDPAREWRVITTLEILPPNLGSIYRVPDLRAYDLLESASSTRRLQATGFDMASGALTRPDSVSMLAASGVRFILSREPVSDLSRVGGLESPGVGVYEIKGAAQRPAPRNAAPDGIVPGACVSLLAAFAAGALLVRAEP